MADVDELKNRVEARKHDIEAEIARLKADAGEKQRDRIERLEKRLQEASDVVKGGWQDLSDSVVSQLNDWLKKEEKKEAASS